MILQTLNTWADPAVAKLQCAFVVDHEWEISKKSPTIGVDGDMIDCLWKACKIRQVNDIFFNTNKLK